MDTKKKLLRKKFRILRSQIPEDEKLSASYQIAESGFEFIKKIAKDGYIISGYYPCGGEVSALPLMKKLQEQCFTCVLPFIEGMELTFHIWDMKEENLCSNDKYIQIKEPKDREEHFIPDILLVPLIAFDSEKHRLGQGGGFYDRAIDSLERCAITIGIGYEKQFSSEELPKMEHDQKLDYIITEKRIF